MPERLVVIAAPFTETERVETRLIQDGLSPETALPVAEAVLDDTLTLTLHSSLRADCWFVCADDASTQFAQTRGTRRIFPRGNDAGERLVHIFEEGFSAGFRSICVIGADMPHLPVAFIQEAFGRLTFGAEVVFGPTEVGGCYLAGIRELRSELFTGIPWGTDRVLQHLLVQVEKQGRTAALLPAGYNLNTLPDVQRLKRDLKRGVVHAPVTASLLAERMP